MEFSKNITVNASTGEVWDVLGRDFANVGVWSTAVSNSVANDKIASVNNSPVGGRLCVTSFGKVSEEFTAYDDDKKTFSFKGVFDSQLFKSIVNTAELTSVNENTTVVKITPDGAIHLTGPM